MRYGTVEAIEVLECDATLGSERCRTLAKRSACRRAEHLDRAAVGLFEKRFVPRLEVALAGLGKTTAIDDEARRANTDREHPRTREQVVDQRRARRTDQHHRGHLRQDLDDGRADLELL